MSRGFFLLGEKRGHPRNAQAHQVTGAQRVRDACVLEREGAVCAEPWPTRSEAWKAGECGASSHTMEVADPGHEGHTCLDSTPSPPCVPSHLIPASLVAPKGLC